MFKYFSKIMMLRLAYNAYSSFSTFAVFDRLQSASGGITLGWWRRTNWYEWSSLLLVHIGIWALKWITRVDTRPAFKRHWMNWSHWGGATSRLASLISRIFFTFHSSDINVPNALKFQEIL